MRRQFLYSQEFPKNEPAPTITFPRTKAPGRTSTPGPIQAGPMRVAGPRKRTVGSMCTRPETVTKGWPGSVPSIGPGNSTPKRAGPIAFTQSHGGLSAAKADRNIERDSGSAKKAEAFTWTRLEEKRADGQRLFIRPSRSGLAIAHNLPFRTLHRSTHA